MREIKYRQAIFLKGEFHHWHYWGYVGYRDEFVGPLTISGIRNKYEVKESQQYIGLKDKTGLRIYEGDKLQWNGVISIAEATEGGWNPFIDDMQADGAWHYEVIGNIYQ